MRPITFAHVSDLHLSRDHRHVNLRNTKRLLDEVMARKPDHVVLTGDIVANAEEKDLDLARRMLQRYGLLDGNRLTVITGNHDIYGGVNLPEEILGFPQRCKKTDVNRKIELFRSFFHEAFEGATFPLQGATFPFLKLVGGIALIGVNSVAPYSGFSNALASNGKVDEAQFEALDRLLGSERVEGKKKFVLIHHHFYQLGVGGTGTIHGIWGFIERHTMKLRGQGALLELFKRHNVDLVMHGHSHETVDYHRNGIRFLNAGGSILATPDLHFFLIHVADSGYEVIPHTVKADVIGLPSSTKSSGIETEAAA